MTKKTRLLVSIVLLIVTISTLIGGLRVGFSLLMKDSSKRIVATKSGFSQQETKLIVDDAFAKINLPSPKLGDSTISIANDEILETLRELLREHNIEMYELKNGEKRTWRVYNRLGVQYHITWESISTSSTVQTHTQKESSKKTAYGDTTYSDTVGTVALIIAGTENKNLEPLIELETPINFALSPTSPFTLRNAVHAANRWHEVLLDTRSLGEIEFDAVPFATAILSDKPFPMSSLPTHQTNSIHQVSMYNSNGSIGTMDPSAKIWLLDISEYPVNTVKEWIEGLPKNIRLVRLSHWDIVSR